MSSSALITGASRGIGRQIAIELASTGYDLGLTARSADELETTAELTRQFGTRVLAVTGDITRQEDVQRVYRTIRTRIGPINVLINNAGFFGGFDSFVESDPQQWWHVLETNLRGPALLTHHVLAEMLSRRHGYIININSRSATRNYLEQAGSAYAVSKAALMRFTSALAGEIAGTGVVVLDFSPGVVRTAMTQAHPGHDDLPETVFSPVTAVAARVAALISGRYDRLNGMFVHFRDDIEETLRMLEDNVAWRP